MVNSMCKADWLVDTTWYHVVSAIQSALCIDFTMVVGGTIRKYPLPAKCTACLRYTHCAWNIHRLTGKWTICLMNEHLEWEIRLLTQNAHLAQTIAFLLSLPHAWVSYASSIWVIIRLGNCILSIVRHNAITRTDDGPLSVRPVEQILNSEIWIKIQ